MPTKVTFYVQNHKNQSLLEKNKVQVTLWVNFINPLAQGTNGPAHRVGHKRCCSISSTELCPTFMLYALPCILLRSA